MGDTWSPINDTEVFLDPTDSWYKEELCVEIYESHVFKQAGVDEPPRKEKRKRTRVSVSAYVLSLTRGLMLPSS